MTLPDWLDNDSRTRLRRQNRRSKNQEDRIARASGGKRVSGSGSSWRQKGDVRDDTFLTEAKYTDRNSYRLDASTWLQIVEQALISGKEPRMIIEFANDGFAVEVRPYES